jgi:hypothetical protein
MNRLLVVLGLVVGQGVAHADEVQAPATQVPAAPAGVTAVPGAARWEYMVLSPVVWNNVQRPRYANGVEVRGWQTMTVVEYLAVLGDEGWELVAVPSAADSTTGGLYAANSRMVFVFKRPRGAWSR